ncbi:MAG: endonuclease/exonuclease/phosphatase family protein [Ignavibacteriales bacterium]|nr:endonuclease/exonuclease/phosphatase family protein [Ignavibacteriales bacterium]
MKKYIKSFATILFIFIIISASVFPQPIRVMTFNIRLDSPDDGENIWKNRKANLTSMIEFYKADLVGLQEAQKHQIDFIMKSLPGYGWFGVGRDDGKEKGEFTAILFRKDRFDTLETSTFWCSNTPEHPGLGWDAAYQRITTLGKFKDKLTDKAFYLFNTHLDNEGTIARFESAKLIKKKMQILCSNYPIILTGDFNSTPDSEPYQIIVSTSDIDTSLKLVDSHSVTKGKPFGPSGTFTGFDLNAKPKEPIDFIFVRKGITVLSHGTLSDSFDGYLPSDHYPVLAEIIL